jgi:hypothetical protein
MNKGEILHKPSAVGYCTDVKAEITKRAQYIE